ncbi:MAG TPA: hypothetical protein VJ728_09570, partial [Candidatus Binataceae bacterium]|nr:hypothetical protein [Candidatus Binataceae bacterium]
MPKTNSITTDALAPSTRITGLHLGEISGRVPLLFEESSSGRAGFDSMDGDESERRAREILGEDNCRADIEQFPELSEPQVMRH